MNKDNQNDAISLRSWVAVLGSIIGCFMAGMNVHVTNASLPDVRGSLGATFEEGSWITTAYLVAEIIIIPVTGWLVSVFGMRKVLMTGTSGFVVFSVVCSLAPNIQTMIFARALQGAFGGVLIPLSFQLIIGELPSRKHALGMALFAVANNVAQAAGPALGGWLTDVWSWRWIFYLQVPPGLLLLAAIGWSVKPQPLSLDKLRNSDWWGMGSMAVGLSALQIMLEEGGREDWFSSPFIINCTIIAATGLVAFVWVELRTSHPFINLRLLGEYNFGVASLMQFSFGAVVFGVVFLVPNYFAELQGYNARQIGMLMIPYGIVQFIMSFATPYLMRLSSPRVIIIAGFVITAVGCGMNIHLNPDASANVIVPSLVVRGIGQSLVVVALGVMAIQGLDKTQSGSASGLFSMVRNVGGAIGIALCSQSIVEFTRQHAQQIGSAVTPFSTATQQQMVDTVRLLAGHAVSYQAALNSSGTQLLRQQALGVMNEAVQRNAEFLAYSDTFWIASVCMFACAVTGLFLRRTSH